MRALLEFELAVMESNVAGMASGDTTDPLHDFRVAMRRFRAILRLFRAPLASTSAREVEEILSNLSDRLSRARDADVRIEFLRQRTVVTRLSPDPKWPAYRDHVMGARGSFTPDLAFSETMQRLRRLVDEELPAHFADAPPMPMKQDAARRLKRITRRLRNLNCPRTSDDPEVWHQLRRTLRRYRYWTECLSLCLEGPVPELARRIHLAAEGLGRLNDMNVYLDVLPREPDPPDELRPLLKELRKTYRRKFAKDWGRLRGKKLQARLKRITD
jgi:CHAD domain-containing protein